MTDEEKKAIEWLKKADLFSARLYAPTILNLIEKQSKEIEELKVINQMQKYRIEVIDEREFISKNTVKAKIEEVEQWELYNMKIPRLSTLDERLGAKIGIKYVLQSLLEKE